MIDKVFGTLSLLAVLVVVRAENLVAQDATLLSRRSSDRMCFEFPIVIVSALDKSFPDPTCNQDRYPAADCLKKAVHTQVQVVDHGNGQPNCFGDVPTQVYDRVKANYRGQTSLFFPKHQMNVKFKEHTAFLNMPHEKNFILNGPYLDCTLLRNHFAHWLYRGTGRFSSHSRHVAMFFKPDPNQIAPQYVGVFLLLEKIGYGKNRVNLAKLDTSCRGEELSGGWAWQNDPLSYHTYSPNVVLDQYQNEFGMGERPVLVHPSGDELSQRMRDYFVNTSTGFLPQLYRFLWHNMTNPDGLEAHLDLGSFADYFLHTEMSLNVDAYRRSAFYFKDRNQPINAGPIWDMNLAYGNGARREFRDWIYLQYTYWKRLMCNYKLASLVIQRWKALRDPTTGPWSDNSINAFIDTSAAPVFRQLKKCSSDWRSNAPYCASVSTTNCSGTYEYQINDLKNAVLNRSHWMDDHILDLYKKLDAGICSGVGEIPHYNCAKNGNDSGCLTNPEAYYKAVKFPPIRKPYQGPKCGAEKTTLKLEASPTTDSDYDKPSVDHCWQSAGTYVYPEQKGVRDSTLKLFCNGYGTCEEGPGAKCACNKGIDVVNKSCERIDSEYHRRQSSLILEQNAKPTLSFIMNMLLFGLVLSMLVFGAVASGMYRSARFRWRRRGGSQSSRLNTYRPVQYGSMDQQREFNSPPPSNILGGAAAFGSPQ